MKKALSVSKGVAGEKQACKHLDPLFYYAKYWRWSTCLHIFFFCLVE